MSDHEEIDGRSAALIMTALAALPRSSKVDKAMNLLFNPKLKVADIVTGVIDNNACGEWMNEEIHSGNDISYTAHLLECEDYKENDECNCDIDWGEVLLGDWKQDTDGLWEPDREGKEGYAAIYNKGSYTIQVAWSKWVYVDARWCSPCYPGQASIISKGGDVLCYILPPELMRCMECEDFERNPVYAVGKSGMMLCDVCCEKFNIDYKTGHAKEVPHA